MPIVGTAGHVDHGKSTLVRALTGTDPDRWAEEKERGLTIDLGFAWTDIDGIDVGFVDVPGHEKFIKNMLAGVGALDCALFVVAADSGWMPQSEEHAAVLDLLDVDRGVIALSRADLVDDETLELATLEILEEVEGTALEGWPVVPVSGVTGDGLVELETAIARRLEAVDGDAPGAFRMWVDRAFTVQGSGQVVTGTVMSGSAAIDDHLEILPSGESVRVRGLHHHGSAVESVTRGDRAAVNAVGTERDLERGMLLTTPDHGGVTGRFTVDLRPTRHFEAIPDRGAFHLHIGTASHPVGLRRIGSSNAFIVTAQEPLPAVAGDRVIVRDSGRRSVVGGGRVLDPGPSQRPDAEDVARLRAAADGTPNDRAQALLDVRRVASASSLKRETGGGSAQEGVVRGDLVMSKAFVDTLAQQLLAEAGSFHAAHPTKPGIAKAELASQHGVDAAAIEAAVAHHNDLSETEGAIHLTSFVNSLSDTDELRWAHVRSDLEATFDVPRMTAIELPPDVVHFLLRRGDLVRIADDLAFTDRQASQLINRVAELDDGFTVSEFKEHFGMSRRQAVPAVEWLDSLGRTRRQGDGRAVRNR